MSPNKILVMALIMTVGLVGSYFLIKNSGSPSTPEESSEKSGNVIANNSVVRWAKNLFSGEENSSAGSFIKFNTTSARAGDPSIDLTKISANAIFEKMKALDQSGQNPFESSDPNDPKNKEIINGMLAGLGKSPSFLNQPVSNEELKISNDNSKEAKAKYFMDLNRIISDKFNNPKYARNPEQIINDIKIDCFGAGSETDKELASVLSVAVKNFLNVAVPSDFIDLHKKTVSFLKSSQSIYQALANCSQDPMGGYMATQALPDLAKETISVRTLLDKKYDEVNKLIWKE